MELTRLQLEILKSVKALQDGERIDLNTGQPIRLSHVPQQLIVAELHDRHDVQTTPQETLEAVQWLTENGYLAESK